MVKYLPFTIPIVLLALLDFANISLLRSTEFTTSIIPLYWLLAVIGYLLLLIGISGLRTSPLERSKIVNAAIGITSAIIINKVVLFIFYIIHSIADLIGLIGPDSYFAGILFFLSLFPLVALLYGTLWGKYNFTKEELELQFKDLPKNFDGFKLVQISDIHSGTWDSIKGVQKGIKLIQKQNPDMIVFTGDLVNSHKDEINPFIHLFKTLTPPFGKFAVLGNHDYYGQPRDKSMRPTYYKQFFAKYKEMGFDLILNDNRKIEREGEFINLIGVENWGSGRFFPKRGDLSLATKGCRSGDFSILLSHDPSHWELKALPFLFHFHLTLSGHTHGMQFGINLPFFKWSPVQYRYKRWMGLYEEANQFLYVNRGFGLLGYPGRVGMSPEVTVIELQKR